MILTCFQCDDAACVKACPVEALKRDDATGAIEVNEERCIRCGICYVYCPTGAVIKVEDGFFDVEADYCNGCSICHRECMCGVISMVEEE